MKSLRLPINRRDLDIFSDEFLAYLELKQDLLFAKIPQGQIAYYLRTALQIGCQLATEMQGSSLVQLYQQQNILVEYNEGDGAIFKLKLRAQFETDGQGADKVVVYRKSIAELAAVNQLSFETAEAVVLAHEYFHFWEFHEAATIPEQLASVQLWRLAGFVKKGRIQRASEIAAHSFAKELLQLQYLPNYFDYQYLLQAGDLSMAELQEEYQEFLTLISAEDCPPKF